MILISAFLFLILLPVVVVDNFHTEVLPDPHLRVFEVHTRWGTYCSLYLDFPTPFLIVRNRRIYETYYPIGVWD